MRRCEEGRRSGACGGEVVLGTPYNTKTMVHLPRGSSPDIRRNRAAPLPLLLLAARVVAAACTMAKPADAATNRM